MNMITNQPHTWLHEMCIAMIALLICYFIIRFRFNYQLVFFTILLKKGLKLIGIILLITCLLLILNHLTSHQPVTPKVITTISHTTKK